MYIIRYLNESSLNSVLHSYGTSGPQVTLHDVYILLAEQGAEQELPVRPLLREGLLTPGVM